jgi:hypothetical protein
MGINYRCECVYIFICIHIHMMSFFPSFI